ncbi:hypothetical protein MAPG_11897 [Magnaporthiopsis poae ATCC 64411]|uniref:Fungal N-terminal domain-containing protein n=1 Tax=Magnaporthiopsis poae (strain ATCC 64411 / 73-15) TaxID=644358 RepID=A0A0C4EGF8_MAGP6|nr:hypothetical protein MAPG_11897 [Magnaporthiopsis poae ATCC 64411]
MEAFHLSPILSSRLYIPRRRARTKRLRKTPLNPRMAEVVGIVSAISGIAATGFALARSISTVAEELGSVGPQLKALATHTQAVAWILDELRIRLKGTNTVDRAARKVISKIVRQCRVEMNDVKKCMEPLLAKKGKRISTLQRIKWLLAKPKLVTKMVALDSLKLTLTMYICAIRFMDDDHFKESMKDEIRHSVLQSENTEAALLRAERLDQEAERVYEADRSQHKLEQDDTESLVAKHLKGTDSSNQGALPPPATGLDGQCQDKGLQTHGTRQTDVELRDTMSADQLARIDNHLHLHAAVSSFALVVVNNGRADPASTNSRTPSDSGPQASFASRLPDPSAASGTDDGSESEISDSDDDSHWDETEPYSEKDESGATPSRPSGAQPEGFHQRQGTDNYRPTLGWYITYLCGNPGPWGFQFAPRVMCGIPAPPPIPLQASMRRPLYGCAAHDDRFMYPYGKTYGNHRFDYEDFTCYDDQYGYCDSDYRSPFTEPPPSPPEAKPDPEVEELMAQINAMNAEIEQAKEEEERASRGSF